MSKTDLIKLYYPISKHLESVKTCMADELLQTDTPLVKEIMEHVLSSSGKLVRSACVLFSFLSGDSDENLEKAIQLAAVIESIHLASLIHDDVIDESDTRRNIATVYKKYGSSNAIVSGTYAYAIAVNLIAKIGDLSILSKISVAVKGLCEGELTQSRSYDDSSLEGYLEAIYKKTAVLFEAACESGARLGAGNEVALKTFGRSLGYIFQLTDDYLDVFGEDADLSKEVGQDFVAGIVTLPYLFLYQNLDTSQRDLLMNLESFESLKQTFPAELSHVKTQMSDLILKYVDDGVSALTPLDDTDKQPLLILLDLVEKRIKKS